MGHFNRPVPSPLPTSATPSSTNSPDGVIFVSASRTDGAYTSDEMYNASARGVRVYIKVTSAGVGNVTTKIQTRDPNTDTWVDLKGATTGAMATAETLTLTVYPGIAAAAGNATTSTEVNNILGTAWRIVSTVAASAGDSDLGVTFSVGAEYLF